MLVLIFTLLLGQSAFAQFDHDYVAWDTLVKKHVNWLPDNKQSRVDYAAFKADRAELKKVLDGFSAVPKSEFDRWTAPQRMAFLIDRPESRTHEFSDPQPRAVREVPACGRCPASEAGGRSVRSTPRA